MKRFTATEKWEDQWFRRLPLEMKALWSWLLDKCDNAGVIDPDLELASFQIGYQYPTDTLSVFGDRVIKLSGGKHFIPKFIEFQYGKLSEDCKAHNPVFASLEKHGIERVSIGYEYPLRKGIGKGLRKGKGTREEFSEFASSLGLPPTDGEYLFDHFEENGWKRGKDEIKDWRASMRKWKSAKWLPSLKATEGKAHRQSGYNEHLELP